MKKNPDILKVEIIDAADLSDLRILGDLREAIAWEASRLRSLAKSGKQVNGLQLKTITQALRELKGEERQLKKDDEISKLTDEQLLQLISKQQKALPAPANSSLNSEEPTDSQSPSDPAQLPLITEDKEPSDH